MTVRTKENMTGRGKERMTCGRGKSDRKCHENDKEWRMMIGRREVDDYDGKVRGRG